MLIPLSTDAPIYYYPFATIGLIVANVLCFAATGFGMNPAALEHWVLYHGQGIDPLGWFSCAFAHAGWIHLIGNMMFLWTFGLVVEGKLGWRRFLPLYLALTAGCGLVENLVTLHHTKAWQVQQQLAADGVPVSAEEAAELAADLPKSRMSSSLGASAVIMGLVSISLVWAPKNEVQVLLLLFRGFLFDLSILKMALICGMLDLANWLWDPRISGPATHLMGFVLGTVVGSLYLKRGWVECEHWDLFAVLSGKYGAHADSGPRPGLHAAEIKTYAQPTVPDNPEEEGRGRSSRSKLLKPINDLIDQGDVLTAADELLTLRLEHSSLRPNEERTRKLALGLLRADAWDQAEIWLQEFIDHYPQENRWARIRLAQLLLQNGRPRAALLQLKGLSTEGLPEGLLKVARKVLLDAQEQRRQGIEDADLFD